MNFDSLKGVAGRVTAKAQEAVAAGSEKAAELSQAAAEVAVDRMIQAVQLAVARIRRNPDLRVPSVSVTASISLGMVGLSLAVDVPVTPPEAGAASCMLGETNAPTGSPAGAG